VIVNFGSLNADFILEMDAIPQAGQMLLATGMRMEAGGKRANQAVAAGRDGAKVFSPDIEWVGLMSERDLSLWRLDCDDVFIVNNSLQITRSPTCFGKAFAAILLPE
jgi:hypothetical protein